MEQIGDSVYHLPSIIGGPTILVGGTVTLVDTGVPNSGDAILDAVASLGRSPEDVADIVITHADGDHVGSRAERFDRTRATVGRNTSDVIEGLAPGKAAT